MKYETGVTENQLINVRDLEFENKVWKNKLDYLIHELLIHLHHVESYQLELKATSVDKLLYEALENLKVDVLKADTIKKRVEIQEEEIPYYIKDFPISHNHILFKDHLAIEKEIDVFYKQTKSGIIKIREQLPGIFAKTKS